MKTNFLLQSVSYEECVHLKDKFNMQILLKSIVQMMLHQVV